MSSTQSASGTAAVAATTASMSVTHSSPLHLSPVSSASTDAHAQTIHFTCQQCKKVSQIDTTQHIPESILVRLNGVLHLTPPLPTASASSSAADQLSLLSESFVVLPPSRGAAAFAPPGSAQAQQQQQQQHGASSSGQDASQPTSPTHASSSSVPGPGRHFAALTRLFDLFSARTGVSHPLCVGCHSKLLNAFDTKLNELSEERKEYERTIQQLQLQQAQTPGPSTSQEDDAVDAAEEEALSREEAELEEKLAQLRKEKQALNIEYSNLDSESIRLSELESAFWKEYEEYSLALRNVTEEQNEVNNQIKQAQTQLERLKRTNVFDDAFHISHDGHFATISGFRLGRTPAQHVEWAETSAALGQVMLLLHTMARHMNYKFKKYRLLPMGSYSKMARLDDLSTTYELYGSNDLILGRLFWFRRFDTALVWLLECIKEFAEFATSIDPDFQLKFPIQNDLIGGYSIKLQFNNDTKWTRALKYMLTNLKYLLAWCAKRKQ